MTPPFLFPFRPPLTLFSTSFFLFRFDEPMLHSSALLFFFPLVGTLFQLIRDRFLFAILFLFSFGCNFPFSHRTSAFLLVLNHAITSRGLPAPPTKGHASFPPPPAFLKACTLCEHVPLRYCIFQLSSLFSRNDWNIDRCAPSLF